MSGALPRREALRAAALGAGALVIAPILRPAAALAQDASAEELRDYLAEAIALEQIAVLAYALAAKADGVDAALRATFERLRDQEQAHANAFRTAVDSLGYDAPEPPDDPEDAGVFDDVDGIDDARAGELADLLARLGKPRRRDEFVELLLKLEREQLAFYAASAPDAGSEDLARTSAEIAANQSQHLVVLESSRGKDPLGALRAIDEAIAEPAS